MGRERRGCVRSRSQLVVYYPRPGTGGHQLTFWCCRISQSQPASPAARFRIPACMIDLRDFQDPCCLADLIKLLPACPAACWRCHARQPFKLYLCTIRRILRLLGCSDSSFRQSIVFWSGVAVLDPKFAQDSESGLRSRQSPAGKDENCTQSPVS